MAYGYKMERINRMTSRIVEQESHWFVPLDPWRDPNYEYETGLTREKTTAVKSGSAVASEKLAT